MEILTISEDPDPFKIPGQIFKVMICGEMNVGKTTLIRKYVDGVFEADTQSTIGVDFSLKTVTSENKSLILQIWDVAGEERFRDVLPSYVPGTKLAILAFDSSNPFTIEELHSWIEVIITSNDIVDLPLLLISTKSDLRRYTNKNKINEMRNNYPNIKAYLPTSAKTGENVDYVFHLVSSILSKHYLS